MKYKIKPRKNQVLLKQDEEAKKETESGLFIPSTVEEEQKAIGTVVAVGPDIKDIKKGDRVIYGAYAGETLSLTEDGKEEKYKLLFEEDVLAFLEEK